ncbi:hypothetical protein BDP27DRAFT_1414347 [Rhodocollybia butyracea]|uniref:Uncharacterized protein n=1 Tax=Rhodocollybia butyracea TaxID=206335 RepID=A0A9P5Q862_9AGAR|nr:hypothetical protein BDP27DRAFT_1414347 [Rhodocollybia butyracea]
MSINDIESELHKTVTIVFWYKSDTEPIRLQQSVPTFPLFQLSRFPTLVTDLGLTPSSYLDVYDANTGNWEQHTIAGIRIVHTGERLLFRIRRSLLNGLSQDECPGLKEELVTQPTTTIRKRHVESSPEELPPRKQAYSVENQNPSETKLSPIPEQLSGNEVVPIPTAQNHILYQFPISSNLFTLERPNKVKISWANFAKYGVAPSKYDFEAELETALKFIDAPAPSSVTQPAPLSEQTQLVPLQSSDSLTLTHIDAPAPTMATLPSYLLLDRSSSIPHYPHPPLKRWPNDYTVYQMSAGFHALEALCFHSSVISTPTVPGTSPPTIMKGPNLTQKVAFERVFGSRYIKSTLCRHKAIWRRAPRELREEFERHGDDERGIWNNFVKRVEGRAQEPVSTPVTG